MQAKQNWEYTPLFRGNCPRTGQPKTLKAAQRDQKTAGGKPPGLVLCEQMDGCDVGRPQNSPVVVSASKIYSRPYG